MLPLVQISHYDYEHKPIVYIDHGSRIEPRHIVTDKALHLHQVRPPISDVDFQNEVSAYGLTGFVEIESSQDLHAMGIMFAIPKY
jgi:dolichyl-phosphate-mannose--protein O-mannosyl transferase